METNPRSVMGFLRMILVRFPCHPCVLFWQPFRKWTLLKVIHPFCIFFQFSITCMAWFYLTGINIALIALLCVQRGIPYLLLIRSFLSFSLWLAMDRHMDFFFGIALIQHTWEKVSIWLYDNPDSMIHKCKLGFHPLVLWKLLRK